MTDTTDTERAELSRRLQLSLAVPVLLLIAVGVVLGLQVQRLVNEAGWVDHTYQVVSRTNGMLKQIVDQETGIRGYLVTDDPIFLEPFQKARPLDSIAVIRELVSDNPTQVDRIDDLRHKYELWLTQAQAVARGEDKETNRSVSVMLARKAQMDSIRATIDAILGEEQSLMKERKDASASSLYTTKILFITVLTALAIFLSLFSRRQLGEIARTFTAAIEKEKASRAVVETEAWQRSALMTLSDALQGDLTLDDLGAHALAALVPATGADIAALFTSDQAGWRRHAGHALDPKSVAVFAKGEGLVGAAADKNELTILKDVPADYLPIRSGTGERRPVELVVVPARLDGATVSIIELGFLRPIEPRVRELLGRIGETIAVAVRSSEYKQRLRDLLEESQQQSEELQAQQEELRVSNEELEEQTNAVRTAQAESQLRQITLEETNARLEEQTNALTRSQHDVLEKAAEVERASKYKSEFLANMSHELRTPLNSTLILAKLLADNAQGNLTDEQVKFAETISSAGNDLLSLINDVLDLSKIESGKIDLNVGEVAVRQIASGMKRIFSPIAIDRGVAYSVSVDDEVPQTILSDVQRVEQILKNLLSNALKFTEKGEVSLRIGKVGERLRFAVKDSGIGIAPEQHDYIFEAFRQADGSTNRKYGGTGLGLSISRDLARLLGGEIALESELGRGSTFTLTLPLRTVVAAPVRAPVATIEPQDRTWAPAQKAAFEDDRAKIDKHQRAVLVIEDDVRFAKILLDLAHELDFRCIVAHDADGGVALAKEHVPSAVLLDMRLPDHPGLSVLDRLKNDPRTRHIPVHVISVDDHSQAAMAMGAVGYSRKPVDRAALIDTFHKLESRLATKVRRVLVVEDDDVQRDAMRRLLEGRDTEIVAVGTVAEALVALKTKQLDVVVTDLQLPDASGFDLLERIGQDAEVVSPPVIVYTGRSLSAAEEQRLRKHSSSIIVKGARSPERLLDEVTLFLHQVEAELPAHQQKMLKHARDREAVFEGRHLLIVEDDVRNIFATSRVLEPKGMRVSIARNGKEALAMLDSVSDIDIVLMDIMMPEMDGIECMQRIRQRPEWVKLPIIALTAKAMKDDQERCLKAGANDYIAKPLDVEMLLSLLRVWMPK